MSRRAARQTPPRHPPPRESRRPPLLLAALLVAAVLAVYGRTIAYEFVEFDDGVTVYLNPGLNPVTAGSLAEFWRQPYRGIYAPVTFTVYGLEALLSPRMAPDAAGREMSAAVFHAGNVALHAVCVLVVFVLLRRLVASDTAAALGALIFGLHPIQAESVAWVTQMRGLLCMAFGLASVWLCVLARDAAPSAASWWRRPWTVYGAATACFILALLSKPAAAAIPLVVAVVEIGWFGGSWRRAALALVPWVMLAAGIAAITQRVQPGFDLPVTTLQERCCVAGDALAFYAGKVVWPAALAPIYDRELDHVLVSLGLCWRWLIPLAVAGAAWLIPGRRTALVSLAIFVAALAPVLGFVPFEYQSMATVADRYAYLAMLGPALGVAALAAAYPSRAAFAAMAGAAALLGALSFVQSAHWRNDDELFPFALALNPHSAEMNTGVGNVAFRRGDFTAAEHAYRTALARDPGHTIAHRNLGLILERRGDTAGAIDHFRRAIETRPDFAEAQISLARALVTINELGAAVAPYRAAIRHAPNDRSGYAGLSVTLLRLDRPSEAEALLRDAIARFPDWPEAHANLAAALAMQGNYTGAAAEARDALRLNPNLREAKDTLEKVQGLGAR